MALVLADRVQQTGTANTTVSFTLSGSVTGFQSFTAGVGNGNTTYYAAYDASGNWEVGLGTYSTTGPTLTRTTVYQSSNAGAAVTFSGTVNVFVTYPASKAVTDVTATSPVASSGGLAPVISLSAGYGDTLNPYASKTDNFVLAAPNGTAGVPTFRNLTLLDLPDAWVKKACDCATTAALTINTAQTTIDGVTISATSRVLVKNQAASAQNGIYSGVTTTTWVRTPDADTASEIAGASVNVDAGTVNGGIVFDNNFKSTDTLGTTAMNWSRNVDVGYFTTVGNNFATLTNPSAITFPRMNADNTVSALGASSAMASLMGFTTTATAAGTTVLTNTSSYYQIFTGTNTQTITLPVTSTLGQGWTFHICNNSTGNLTVNSSGGNLVLTVIPGTTVMCTCIATGGTTVADWEAGYTDFSTLTGTGSVVLAASPTLTGTTTVATFLPTAMADTGSLARNAGLTAVTTIAATTTYTSGGVTLANQTAVAGSVWRVRAMGTFVAANSATARNVRMAIYWGTASLVTHTLPVTVSVARTSIWSAEYIITGSSSTALWVVSQWLQAINQAGNTTSLAGGTPTSLTVTSGAQTLDLRFSVSTVVAGDSFEVQSVTMERLE